MSSTYHVQTEPTCDDHNFQKSRELLTFSSLRPLEKPPKSAFGHLTEKVWNAIEDVIRNTIDPRGDYADDSGYSPFVQE